jgi:hypothetical protein
VTWQMRLRLGICVRMPHSLATIHSAAEAGQGAVVAAGQAQQGRQDAGAGSALWREMSHTDRALQAGWLAWQGRRRRLSPAARYDQRRGWAAWRQGARSSRTAANSRITASAPSSTSSLILTSGCRRTRCCRHACEREGGR